MFFFFLLQPKLFLSDCEVLIYPIALLDKVSKHVAPNEPYQLTECYKYVITYWVKLLINY